MCCFCYREMIVRRLPPPKWCTRAFRARVYYYHRAKVYTGGYLRVIKYYVDIMTIMITIMTTFVSGKKSTKRNSRWTKCVWPAKVIGFAFICGVLSSFLGPVSKAARARDRHRRTRFRPRFFFQYCFFFLLSNRQKVHRRYFFRPFLFPFLPTPSWASANAMVSRNTCCSTAYSHTARTRTYHLPYYIVYWVIRNRLKIFRLHGLEKK